MTETQEIILHNYFPEYEEYKSMIELYSEYELNLIVDNLPENIDDLPESINKEVQWDILAGLCKPFIDNWDEFSDQYESEIIDYFWENDSIISYNDFNHSYELSKESVINMCKDLVSVIDDKYIVNEEVNFSEVLSYLNKYYPIKFCEV